MMHTITYEEIAHLTEETAEPFRLRFWLPRIGEFTDATGGFEVLPASERRSAFEVRQVDLTAGFPGIETIPNRPPGHFAGDYDEADSNRSNAFGNAEFEVDS